MTMLPNGQCSISVLLFRRDDASSGFALSHGKLQRPQPSSPAQNGMRLLELDHDWRHRVDGNDQICVASSYAINPGINFPPLTIGTGRPSGSGYSLSESMPSSV